MAYVSIIHHAAVISCLVLLGSVWVKLLADWNRKTGMSAQLFLSVVVS